MSLLNQGMDCTEVFFKLVEIPIAAVAAAATVWAAIYAWKAFQAQSKQLRNLEEDRMFAGLSTAPRFAPYRDIFCIYESLGIGDEPTAFLVPKLSVMVSDATQVDRLEDVADPIWFNIKNVRDGVRTRKIHVVLEDGQPSPVKLIGYIYIGSTFVSGLIGGTDSYLVSYPESLAAQKTRIQMKIYFETYSGIEGVHTYETVCGTLDFRRIHPPSVIDNAGIQFQTGKEQK